MNLSEEQKQEDLTIINLELTLGNMHYNKYRTLCRVPKRYKELRYEKLSSICNTLGYEFVESDLKYFEECMN